MLGECFRRSSAGSALSLVILTLVALLGCAQERKPINKVQANALDKTFFVGNPGNPDDDPTFYWRNFVVDASEGQELIGVGSWSGVDRIKWEITENTLFARRAYGQNAGADDKGSGSGFPNGTIVAAYPILSHFDVKRAYNPQTGEELNVIEENTTDRPWNERQFFRVDWSINQVDSPLWTDMFIGKLTGEVKLTPIAYYVSDPAHDDAPHFDAPGGYFDVTSKFLVEPTPLAPGQTDNDGISIPSCVLLGFVTGTAVNNCDAQEAIIRSSYWRMDQVDPDDDFEPFENTRATLDIVGNPGGIGDSLSAGIVTPPRVSWDPGYGYTDSGTTRLMNVHDIWKQSHQTRGTCKVDADCGAVRKGSVCLPSGTCTLPCTYSPTPRENGHGTDIQCTNDSTGYKGSEGSQCSIKNRCTIPYRDRETKAVAWWVNVDMPDDFQDELDSKGKVTKRGATEDVIFSWNQAVNLAVAHAREVECRRTGGSRATCHAQYFEPGQTEMVSFGGWGIEKVKTPEDLVVTCHNPVREYDPDVCGERNATARVGDLRHHFVFYWPFASEAPWGGIANWNADPLTGRIIGASATVMGRSVTLASAQTRDIVLVQNGDLDMTDITGGVPAELYQTRLRLGQHVAAPTAEELARRVAAVDVKHSASELGLTLPGKTTMERIDAIVDMKMNTSSDPALLSSAVAEFDGLAAPLRGSKYEAQLVGPSWLVDSAGVSPQTTVTDSVLEEVSPLRGRDPAKLRLMTRTATNRLENHGVCLFAPNDVGNLDVRGVARWFADPRTGVYGDAVLSRQYPQLAGSGTGLRDKRADLIYQHLVKETYKGILLHEVGHGMGMLHNFTSSYDAVNYNPQYWQLRTDEGRALDSCNAQPRTTGNNDSCMGPRFLDPETDDELGQAAESRPGINYFGGTSTMEYQNERFFETVGLGQYDVMTMGALYGRVLETFDPDAADGVALDDQADYTGLTRSQLSEDDIVSWTTDLGTGRQPMHYTELARRIHLFDQNRCRKATDDEVAQGEWRIVHGEVCAAPPKDYARWNDFIDQTGPKTLVAPDAPSAKNQVRWPYRWGSDGGAYLHVNPSDAGADPYEVVQQAVQKFDYSYPFQYFRRQRRDWNYLRLPSLTANRYFELLRAYHWVVARNNAFLGSLGLPQSIVDHMEATDDVTRSNLLAATSILDALSKALLLPQVGAFDRASDAIQAGTSTTLFDAVGGSGPGLFSIDATTGRFVDPQFDSGSLAGGSWDYNNWMLHAGFFVEKGIAAMALTDGRPTLQIIQRDTYIDGRHLYINFRTDMAKAVDRLVGGVLASDWETIAPYVTSANSPVPASLSLTDDAPARPDRALVLFPNLGYRQQLFTLVLGELFSRQGTDLTLANKLRVTLEGTEGVIDIPDAQKIKFTDPRSGFTYVARLFGPDTVAGKTVDQGIGSRMLAQANALLASAYQVELDERGKPVVDGFGRPQLSLDGSGNPIPSDDPTKMTAYTDYIGLIDTEVQVANLIGHGPLR